MDEDPRITAVFNDAQPKTVVMSSSAFLVMISPFSVIYGGHRFF